MKTPNLAIGKKATQSSVAEMQGAILPDVAALGAIDGNINKDYGFQTKTENNPWWRCDLGCLSHIRLINIFNRHSTRDVMHRLFPFQILASNDDVEFRSVYASGSRPYVGCGDYHSPPIQVIFAVPIIAQFIKIMVMAENRRLHLAQVEIYG